MYSEDDLLPISALQHLAFCERQWALIHLEGAWAENRLTAEGRLLHDRPHEPETEVRGDLRIARGLQLRSLRFGLVGKADVVEFHRVEDGKEGLSLEDTPGLWQPFVVEYKRGHPKIGHEDEIQLCAQVFCLEEMLGVSISSASFFYGEPRRRYEVALDNALRQETEQLIARLHQLTVIGQTPQVEYTPKCKSCSLIDLCLPGATGGQKSACAYLKKSIVQAEETVS